MKPIAAAMVSVSGLTLTDTEKYLLSTYQPMGITLFKRNIDTVEQVQALTKEIREVIGRVDVLIAVDQEGGRVCRFEPPHFGKYISQFGIGSLSEKERLRLTELHAILIAEELQSLGVNLNYAPCLDVRYPETAPVLASRCFSDNPQVVADCGRVMIQTYLENEIIPCMKHLPGHGRVVVDPHLQLPRLDQTVDELTSDFLPFQTNAINCPMGMTAHIVIPEIDAEYPVTQSKNGIQVLIRETIGFDGFLISDAIDMRALRGSLTEKVESVLTAGCDGICYCGGDETELKQVLQTTPPLTDNARWRFADCFDSIDSYSKSINNSGVLRFEYEQLSEKASVPIDDYDAVEVLNQMSDKANEKNG